MSDKIAPLEGYISLVAPVAEKINELIEQLGPLADLQVSPRQLGRIERAKENCALKLNVVRFQQAVVDNGQIKTACLVGYIE